MEKASYFKIGLFIIVGTIIGAIGVVALGVGTIFQKKVLVETYIDESVQGLDVGSSVKFRGVQVGKVETISLTSAEYPTKRRYVLVRIGLTTKIFLADAGVAKFPGRSRKRFTRPTGVPRRHRRGLYRGGLSGPGAQSTAGD